MDMLILIGSFCVLCLLGMPVAYALGLAAIIAALWIDLPLEAVMLKTSDGMDDFALLAIPFFILAGGIMAEGGMATRLVNLAKVFVGFIRGGLALVNILASTMFGCISGSSVADTAAIGSVMIPQMIKAGYPRLFAVNVTIAGSLQPLLIPPSHNAVIYSLAAGGTISVAHLFIAGIIPGLMLGLSLMILCFYIARRDNFPKGDVIPLGQAIKIAGEAFWGLVTVFIIIGGILSGVFTPTEFAAVACIYSFLVTMFIYRDYKWSELPLLVGRVVRTVGMVMIMIGFSIAFGYMMAIMQIPAKVTAFFVAVSSDKYMFLFLINILLLVLGTFMDLAPMLLICTPIFLPVVKMFGIDPVHFGMIMILNLGIGLLTPPVGPTLVVGCAIGKVSMEAVSKSIMIFYIPMLIVLAAGHLHPGAVALAAEPAARQMMRGSAPARCARCRRDVARPRYDRAGVATGIVHLGVGAFQRAHQAMYTEAAIAAGDRRWGIVGASLRSPAVRDQLAPQDGLYTLAVRGADGERLQVIGALKDVLVAPEDPEALLRALVRSGGQDRHADRHREGLLPRSGDDRARRGPSRHRA